MQYAEILADSINAATGDRLTTFKIRLWKLLLAELNTHRSLSRSAASSRAIPASRIRAEVLQHPYTPIYWGVNQKGMQARAELPSIRRAIAKKFWLGFRFPACALHYFLGNNLKLHKQLANRILEPWLTAEVILSATEWDNFFRLRAHEDAQPEFEVVARSMKELYASSVPTMLDAGEWHLPLILPSEQALDIDTKLKVSAARAARASYMRLGATSEIKDDLALCDCLLANPPHVSPFEHQALALPSSERHGNFVGWLQQRKTINNEHGGDYQRICKPPFALQPRGN